jgi:hypothetical protein
MRCKGLMYLVLEPDQVKRQYILMHAPVKNTVMDNSNFIRILYSDGVVSLNGLHVRARLHTARVERYFNKYKCTIDTARSARDIAILGHLEQQVLEQAGIRGKTAVKRISDQLRQGSFKLFSENPHDGRTRQPSVYILKMSGVWETEHEYGVTHKFMEVRSS